MEASCDGGASSSPEEENDKIWCLQPVGKEHGWLRLFENCEVTVGRGLNVTHQIISVTYPLMISRNHCMFKQREDGKWTVTDKESMNGVWVNGNRIPSDKPHVLQQDDIIRFGVPLEGNLDEFVYVLVHCSLGKVKDYLTKKVCAEASAASSAPKAKQSKRKFGTDETEPCTSVDSKSKLYRASTTDKSAARPFPKPGVKEVHQTLCRPSTGEKSTPAGPSRPPSSLADSGLSSQQLATLQRYSTNLRALKERMGATHRQAAELEGQDHESPGRRQKMQELQEQMELLRGQLSSQQEQALQRVEALERRLETENIQQNEDGLKKQLEEALKEHRKVIEELQHAREGFKEVLQAKDKELEVTKEEKEKERAQKEEVVTQMTKILENEMQCIICSELFIEAVTLNCAHSFCQHCIQDWRRRKDECPICRQAIMSQTRSLVLDNCINSMVENLSAEMRERRLTLITERKGQSKAPSQAVVVIRGDSSSDTDSSLYSSMEGYLVNPRFPYYIDSSDSSSWSE